MPNLQQLMVLQPCRCEATSSMSFATALAQKKRAGDEMASGFRNFDVPATFTPRLIIRIIPQKSPTIAMPEDEAVGIARE